jgi:hypothetical protein
LGTQKQSKSVNKRRNGCEAKGESERVRTLLPVYVREREVLCKKERAKKSDTNDNKRRVGRVRR